MLLVLLAGSYVGHAVLESLSLFLGPPCCAHDGGGCTSSWSQCATSMGNGYTNLLASGCSPRCRQASRIAQGLGFFKPSPVAALPSFRINLEMHLQVRSSLGLQQGRIFNAALGLIGLGSMRSDRSHPPAPPALAQAAPCTAEIDCRQLGKSNFVRTTNRNGPQHCQVARQMPLVRFAMARHTPSTEPKRPLCGMSRIGPRVSR